MFKASEAWFKSLVKCLVHKTRLSKWQSLTLKFIVNNIFIGLQVHLSTKIWVKKKSEYIIFSQHEFLVQCGVWLVNSDEAYHSLSSPEKSSVNMKKEGKMQDT